MTDLIPASPEQLAVAGPDGFFGGNGLLATSLVREVERIGPVAAGDGGELYFYKSGWWQADGERIIRNRVYRLLADRYRMTHASTVVDVIRNGEMLLSHDKFDSRYLNLPNGLLDWKTGKRIQHSPDILARNRIPVRWNPKAECPAIMAWMRQVFPEDCLSLAEEIMGLVLFDGNPFHTAVMPYGSGRNGKGTWLRLIKALAGSANVSAIAPQTLDDNRFAAAELAGKLANLIGDVDPRIFKVTEMFKKITGEDLVTAERKYGQPFRFTNRSLLICGFNQLPNSADTSTGFFSRWLVLPFPNKFVEGKADIHLDEKLQTRSELEGLLVLAVNGLRRLMERGCFTEPDSVKEAKEEFERKADQIRAFIEDCLDLVPGEWVSKPELFRAYSAWAMRNQHQQMSVSTFYERAQLAGLTLRKRDNVRGFANIVIQEHARPWQPSSLWSTGSTRSTDLETLLHGMRKRIVAAVLLVLQCKQSGGKDHAMHHSAPDLECTSPMRSERF